MRMSTTRTRCGGQIIQKCGGAFLHCFHTAATSLKEWECQLLCMGFMYLDHAFADALRLRIFEIFGVEKHVT